MQIQNYAVFHTFNLMVNFKTSKFHTNNVFCEVFVIRFWRLKLQF